MTDLATPERTTCSRGCASRDEGAIPATGNEAKALFGPAHGIVDAQSRETRDLPHIAASVHHPFQGA